MDLTGRRRFLYHRVVESGGHTITMEAGVVTPDEDAQDITITHNKNKVPLQASITLVEVPAGGFEADITYGTSGAGVASNNIFPLVGYRAHVTATPAAVAGVYNCNKTATAVQFKAYSSTSHFKAGVEYVYEIMWID